MAQKVNPVAVRLHFNRFSDSSWFSDYYYSTLLYQDLNFRQYLSSIKQPSANKLGFRTAKCIIHHFPKRSLIHLFCLSDPRKRDSFSTSPNITNPSPFRPLVTTFQDAPASKKFFEEKIERETKFPFPTSHEFQPVVIEAGFGEELSIRSKKPAKGSIALCSPVAPSSTVSSPSAHAPSSHLNFSAENVLPSGDHTIIENSVDTWKREGVTLSLENEWIRTFGPLSFGTYWLKSSNVQKKKALANLHRGIVETYSQLGSKGQHGSYLYADAPFGKGVDHRLRVVSSSSRFYNENTPLVGWYRKTRAKISQNTLRHRAPYQAGMMMAAFPRGVFPFLRGSSKLRRFMTMWSELAQHSTKNRSVKNVDCSNTLADLPSSKGFLWGLNPSNLGWSSSSSLPLSSEPLLGEQVKDPTSRRIHVDESLFMQLRHSIFRSHYFNFYAMHYYFMNKMGNPNDCLPPKLTRSSVLFPANVRKEGNSLNDQTPKIQGSARIKKHSGFRHSVLYPTISGSSSKAAYGGNRVIRRTGTLPDILESNSPYSLLSRIQGSRKRFLQRNSIYLLPSNRVGTNVDSHFTGYTNPGNLFDKDQSKQIDFSLHKIRQDHSGQSGFLFDSRSENPVTKSIDFSFSNVHSILSQNTNTFLSLHPIKVHSVFQCASLVAQEVACKLEQKKSLRVVCRLIFQQLAVCDYIKGIRITCSGRLNGAEIAKTECRKFGETSLHVFSDKIDYARAEASTPYGILGIKVWISYI